MEIRTDTIEHAAEDFRRAVAGEGHTCPNCGNTDDRFIENNGLSPTAYGFTLLCVARVRPGLRSWKHVKPRPDQIDAAGKVQCGEQWSPNEG
jgi:hypothetical protein